MRLIRLVWSFRGPDAKAMANHHLIHLNEYLSKHKLSAKDSGILEHSEHYTSAYILCSEELAIELRDPLRPHEAFVEE